MINTAKIALLNFLLVTASNSLFAQSFNVGFIFQYHVLKQIDVKANTITGTYSHDQFTVKENNWKAFAAGQSVVVGMMAQMNYKKFYLTTEVSFNLNTYRYNLFYPITPDVDEKVTFETLYFQWEFPLYLGYQFQSTNLVRYSVFGGGIVTFPWSIGSTIEGLENQDENLYDRYSRNDMRYILYNDDPYLSGIVGFGIHIASLAKVDVRYIHRLGNPGPDYKVDFNTVGIAFTYFFPLHLTKKRIYYED